MKAKIVITSVGVGGVKGLGVNVGSAAYIQLGERVAVRNYGISDVLSLGEKSHTLAVGHVATTFFHLSEDARDKLLDLDYLAGKSLEVEVKGTLALRGQVDVRLILIDAEGAAETLIERLGIPAFGAQLATTQVRGRIKLLSGRLHLLEGAK